MTLNSSSHSKETGKQRFAVEGLLGEGGMASVFRAHDAQQQKVVALKVLKHDEKASSAAQERRLARFKQEFEILKKLQGLPGVVQCGEFFDVTEVSGIDENGPSFTMEVLEGRVLADEIKSAEWSSQSSQQACASGVAILSELARALGDIHARGVIFCDLKPGNVKVVAPSGCEKRIKLFDFGIAQLADSSQADTMVGTTFYMAPEQIQGEKLTFSADIYAFGVLAFEVLTGRLPFNDEVLFNVTASHLASKVPSVRELSPEVPAAVERMIKICMEKQPKNRYANMGEVAQRLSEVGRSLNHGDHAGLIRSLISKLFRV